MKHSFSVALQPCGSCVSHSHCKDCCSRIEEDLLKTAPVREVSLDPVKKLLTVEADADSDTLEDLLDDMGVFVLWDK